MGSAREQATERDRQTERRDHVNPEQRQTTASPPSWPLHGPFIPPTALTSDCAARPGGLQQAGAARAETAQAVKVRISTGRHGMIQPLVEPPQPPGPTPRRAFPPSLREGRSAQLRS